MEDKRTCITDFIHENQAALYRLAFVYVKNRDAALDIVQDTVVQAISHSYSLKSVKSVKPWIYRILVNESMTYLRKNRRVVYFDELPELAANQEDLAGKLDVYRAVQRLEPRFRTIVALRYYEDMKLEDIAQVTGVRLSTVKTRLYQALNLLKKDLGCEIN